MVYGGLCQALVTAGIRQGQIIGMEGITVLDKIVMVLIIIGSLVWGLIGIFNFDVISWLFGSQQEIVSRIIFTLVGLAGIWGISFLFRKNDVIN